MHIHSYIYIYECMCTYIYKLKSKDRLHIHILADDHWSSTVRAIKKTHHVWIPVMGRSGHTGSRSSRWEPGWYDSGMTMGYSLGMTDHGFIRVHMGSYGIRDGTMQSAIRQKLPDLAKNGKDMAAIHFIIFGHKLSWTNCCEWDETKILLVVCTKLVSLKSLESPGALHAS